MGQNVVPERYTENGASFTCDKVNDLLDSIDIDNSVPNKTSEQIDEILTRKEEERNNESSSNLNDTPKMAIVQFTETKWNRR